MSKTKILSGMTFCLLAATAGWAQGDTKTLYLDKCSVCHGEDGAGKTAKGRKLKIKDVRETSKSVAEAEMVRIVTDGKGKDMDAYGKELSAAQIKEIVQYYRGLAK